MCAAFTSGRACQWKRDRQLSTILPGKWLVTNSIQVRSIEPDASDSPRYCASLFISFVYSSYRPVREVYYRIYTKYGAINSYNPIYANNPFISRTLATLIPAPHSVSSVKKHLCWIERFPMITSHNLNFFQVILPFSTIQFNS
jgi:hypothetical protein